MVTFCEQTTSLGYEICNQYEVTFKYIWTNHLPNINNGCAFVGIKISNDNNKSNNNNHNYECLYSMFVNNHFCVMRSSVCHIDSWNCPKCMHKSTCTKILVCSHNIFTCGQQIQIKGEVVFLTMFGTHMNTLMFVVWILTPMHFILLCTFNHLRSLASSYKLLFGFIAYGSSNS